MERYLLNPRPADVAAASRRHEARESVFTMAALVSGEGLPAVLNCTVHDLSPGGARLEMDRDFRRPAPAIALPRRVMVYLCPKETEYPSRVTWQDGAHFGVAFLQPEAVADDAGSAEAEPRSEPADPQPAS